MRQINPMAKAWANAEKTHHRRERGKVIWQKRMKAGHEFLEGTHRYERTFSDQGVGEMRVMGGRDAKALNDKLFEDYLVAMEANIAGRSLERWKLTEQFVEANKEGAPITADTNNEQITNELD